MEQKCDRLYPSAPFENKKIDLEQRLEKNWMILTVLITTSATSKKWLHTSKIKTTNQKRNLKNTKQWPQY